MASQERLLILKMLQEGTISAEDALKLLEASAANPAPATPSTASIDVPEVSNSEQAEPESTDNPAAQTDNTDTINDLEAEVIARAKAKIAAAREKVAAVAADHQLQQIVNELGGLIALHESTYLSVLFRDV